MMQYHACWTATPKPHPWEKDIKDMNCGYERRMTDKRCHLCHRRHPASPAEQLHGT